MARNAAHRFRNDLRYRDDAHPAQDQLTPAYVLDLVREDLGGVICLDPCTTEDNPAGALKYYCPPADGAAVAWDAGTIYVNPPYSRARERWVRRCLEAAGNDSTVILLIPAATDTRIFQAALATASAVVLIRGRVKFGVLRPNRRQAAASHPSALIGWNTGLDACTRLGTRLRVSP